MHSTDSSKQATNAFPERVRWLVVCLFFASGLCGLVYQVLWMHTLVLVFGGTTLAISTVLAVFMGGLALGSYLAGKYADRAVNPFLWYGLLEGAIGVWAIFTPFMFDFATPAFRLAYQYSNDPAFYNLVRVAVACVILLPPTTCMGATLPLLSKMVAERLESLGNRIGLLYSVNTVGATVGTVLAGFYLVPNLGLTATVALAAAINIALAITVFIVQKRLMKASVQSGTSDPADQPDGTTPTKLPRSTLLIITLFAIAGAASMIYEVAWTRALLLVIGSSTFAFTVMLTAFLLGIVIGSLACSRFIDRLPDAVYALAILELLAGLTAFAGLSLFGYLPYINVLLGEHWYQNPDASIVVRFLLAGLILMPLTFCLGATFPAVVKTCAKQLEQVGRSVGSLYSANTMGAILGAVLAGFYLVPAWGLERAIVVAALTNIAIGAALLSMVPSVRMPTKVIAATAAVVLIGASGQFPPFFDRLVLLLAQNARRELMVGNHAKTPSYSDFVDGLHARFKLLFYKEGTSSSAAIILRKSNEKIMLLTNGHIDASTTADMSVQELLSYLPMWCHADAKTAAVVGWGSGISVGVLTLFPLTRIDAIELEPAVMEAARYFNLLNHRPENNPKVNVIANDGRNFLLTTNNKYDVIVSEPSNPWQAGVCNLFTREYFRICKNRLNEDGILSLWLQISEVSPDAIRQIGKALASEFPHTLTFQPDGGNLVILASNKTIKIDCQKIDASLKDEQSATDFKAVNIRSTDDVLVRLLMSDQQLRRLCENANANTDNRNRVEYEVAKTYESRLYHNENNAMLQSQPSALNECIKWPALSAEQLSAMQAGVAETAFERPNYSAARYWIASAFQTGQSADAFRVRGLLEASAGEWAKARNDWLEAIKLDPDNARTFLTRAQQLVWHGDAAQARMDYQVAQRLDPNDLYTRYLLARSYAPYYIGCKSYDNPSEPEKVLPLIAPLLSDSKFVEAHPIVLFLAADTYFRLGKLTQAQQLCKQFIAVQPDSIATILLLSRVEAALGHLKESADLHSALNNRIHQTGGLTQLIDAVKQLIANNRLRQAKQMVNMLEEYAAGDKDVDALRGQLSR